MALKGNSVMKDTKKFAEVHDRVQVVQAGDFPRRVIYDKQCPVLCEEETPNWVLALQQQIQQASAGSSPWLQRPLDLRPAHESL